jgi:dipeptidyl aminopeptidase/acylaminoacyl peptidase
MPVWSPDGKRIAFGSRRNGKWGLYVKVADNTRTEDLLFESEAQKMPMSWSPDGRLLVYWTIDPRTSGDIWSVSVPAPGTAPSEMKPTPILQTLADERNPQVSPDGKWLAYSSNEGGRSEIYIRPFPEGPGKIQVSVNGGVFPRWRRDGEELYFMNLVSLGAMMKSDIRVTGSSVQRDVPRLLFQSLYVIGTHPAGQYHAYAVSADGKRFLIPQFENLQTIVNVGRGGVATTNAAVVTVLPAIIADRNAATSPSGTSSAPITVVLNWTSALKGN